jgi:peroxiredoxin
MSLQDQLDALRAEHYAKTPPHLTLVRQRAVRQLMTSGLAERAVHAGDRAPAFRLRDGNGDTVSSDDLLCIGPVLIVFYKGRWYPYCNLDLSAIQSASGDIRSAGASIVAVSEQRPADCLETVRMNGLSFPSLVDGRGKLASAFGLRWKASAELGAVLGRRGAGLTFLHDEQSGTVVMPARYIVAPDGTVEYVDIRVDYARRGDPSDLFTVLDHLRTRSSPYRNPNATTGRDRSELPESVSVRPNRL